VFTELKPGQRGARMRWAEKPASEEKADSITTTTTTTTTNSGDGGGGGKRGLISPGGLASMRRTGESGKRIARGKLNRTMAHYPSGLGGVG
jgi:hypothetical protein